MFHRITVSKNTAVPHLHGSLLMESHANTVAFSREKPNVIVGPNGAGKSALMTALSISALTHFSGVTSLDENFTKGRYSDSFWSERTWQSEPKFHPGIDIESDHGAAVFYRPGHIPGNDHCVTAAMMCGYFEEAKAFGQLVDEKSSGQASQAILARAVAVLKGELTPKYEFMNWDAGKKPSDFKGRGYVGPWDYRNNQLLARYQAVTADAVPVVLMDEPEQSLDARAELQLWKTIQAADTTKMQVIVATHSLYPLLHPEHFHIIEASPGYAREVTALL